MPITAATSPQRPLRLFAELYEIESQARERKLDVDARRHLRQQRAKPLAETLRQWLVGQKHQVPDGSATAKAIEYSLGRWAALTRYLVCRIMLVKKKNTTR